MEKQKISSDSARHLLHPKLTVLVTCVGENGEPNIITIAWAIPVSIDPPLLAISIGKSRHSHDLVSESGEFAINIPDRDYLEEVKFCGSKSGSKVDKFAETDLTKKDSEEIEPPIISECIANIECRVTNEFEAGDHTVFIGKIVASLVDENAFDNRSKIFDMDNFSPILHVGGSDFVTSGEKID